MTVEEIIKEVNRFKRCKRGSVYNYIRSIGIKPVGKLRQRPQRYPDDAAEKIIEELGLDGVVGMRKLRAVRDQARKARAA